MTIAAGSLTYGTQYAFTVVAVNDLNAGSRPSPASNTVVPFAAPGRPRNLTRRDRPRPARRHPGQLAGGRRTTAVRSPKYVVDAGGGTAGRHRHHGHPHRLRRRRGRTGEGPRGQRGRRRTRRDRHRPDHRRPHPDLDRRRRRLQLSQRRPSRRTTKAATRPCAGSQVGGAGTAQANCTTQPVTLTVNGLWPNNTYSYTVSVTSAAGAASATRSRATNQMRFTVICPNNSGGYCNSGIWAYRVPSQQSSGQAVNPSLSVGATAHAAVPHRRRQRQCHTVGWPQQRAVVALQLWRRHRLLPVRVGAPRRSGQRRHHPGLLRTRSLLRDNGFRPCESGFGQHPGGRSPAGVASPPVPSNVDST